MSAIVAGKACKTCGKEYCFSFGHPKWFDDVVKRRLPKNEQFLEFEKFANSGQCAMCYSPEEKEAP